MYDITKRTMFQQSATEIAHDLPVTASKNDDGLLGTMDFFRKSHADLDVGIFAHNRNKICMKTAVIIYINS